MLKYSDRFWKSSWDKNVNDVSPELFDTTVHGSLKSIFTDFPDRMALAFQGNEIPFSEVDKRSNQFARMLIDNGFKLGDIVGINLPNIPEYVFAMIGALKVGCIVSGISPMLSDVQMHYQITDLGAGQCNVAILTLDAIFQHRLLNIASKLPDLKLMVATSVIGYFSKVDRAKIKAVKEIPSGEVTPIEGKVVLDFWDDVIAKYSDEPVNVEVTPDDIAFIQYTGGTTGPPKGAELTHKNIASQFVLILEWLKWERGKGVALSGFPLFHAAGLVFCLNVMSLGISQVLIPDPRDTANICNEMSKYKPILLVNVASLYQLLINTRKFKRIKHDNLQNCISGASPFPAESQKQLEDIVGKGKLLELYGMTETSPVTVMNPDKNERRLGWIGLPLPNTEMKLVDYETGEEVPVGEPGEILVKGPMVMKGYHNKPEETKNSIDSDGYMHTGDVAIMDEKGYLKIVDRTKDMIIVSGFKVFSAKLEDNLAKHPAIEMVATVGVPNPDRPGSEFVKAYIQIDPKFEYDGNEDALKEDIIKFARENCATYEVPKFIEFSEELPLTSIGKIDKKVLRKK